MILFQKNLPQLFIAIDTLNLENEEFLCLDINSNCLQLRFQVEFLNHMISGCFSLVSWPHGDYLQLGVPGAGAQGGCHEGMHPNHGMVNFAFNIFLKVYKT